MAPPSSSTPAYNPATIAIHGDDWLNKGTDVAPALHVSTTFRYKHNPDELVPFFEAEEPATTDFPPVYSRLTAPNTTRLEALLSQLMHGRALTYSSGLAAFHAMMVYLRPNVIAIGHDKLGGYHGCHGVLALHTKMHGLKLADLHDEATWDALGLAKGDVVHVETPLNPTGEAYDIAAFADKAHRRGAYLTVDSTFGPPGLQDPFALGADVVMHSGTKYIGGHSDMLCGVLAVPPHREDWFWGLWNERVFLGSTMGSLEGWLGVRSLRTLELRVRAQSRNAERVVAWLHENLTAGAASSDPAARTVAGLVGKVAHASLQTKDLEQGWLRKQMPNGFGPVFALWMKTEQDARRLPSKLKLFHHATSLGGVESLVEWRRMSDKSVDPTLLRFSIGAESWEDLRDDLASGFAALAEEKNGGKA
ncbi:Cystathionine gamma-synthase [Neofusicoccum parvum]|uniref:Cystathionine gamma-synthase n=2 Tax=Neofusicoccum parvum TaxID=310453 RepID=A0ACB5RPS4_9PEZI|nr:putative cystathionine gamma-synthase protein [Neofusicoccum parvum UCRNP2]GME22510.1 Cystathionine gamma-synthase [Neofusicoccum parvum]GME46710.1 Cystathionine gamma-synthase [Neofusicoccum parvum]